MTLQLKKTEVNDKSILTSMIIDSWDTICPDISLIDTSIVRYDDTVFDLVGINSDKALVLVLIELADEKEILMNLINSFDWSSGNLNILGKIYSQCLLDTNSPPAIIVIAPNFSKKFITALTYLNVPEVGLYKFFCIDSDGKKGVLLEEVRIPGKKRITQGKREREKHVQICLECLGVTKEEEREFLSFQNNIVSAKASRQMFIDNL